MEDEDNNKAAYWFAIGLLTMGVIHKMRMRDVFKKHSREMRLANQKNAAMHRYIFDEVQNPKALENMYVDAKFIQIVEKNKID